MKKILTILLCLLTLFGAIIFTVCKNDNDINLLKGNVIYIYDGDTIEIKTYDGKEYKIRLSGIDAPEYDQKYGKESGEYLTLLINGKDVCIKVYGTDKYNRICNLATKNSNETKVKDETIEDTLKDLANYCIMTLIEMQYKNITQTISATKRSIKSDKLEISDKENSLSSEIERFIS